MGLGTVYLPDSRSKLQKNVVRIGQMNWVPIFCANCGADGGLVPEENCNFAFYLCQSCADRLGNIDGVYMVPDEVFWKEVNGLQEAMYGRLLTAEELVDILKDENHAITKLCKDRKDFNKIKMT